MPDFIKDIVNDLLATVSNAANSQAADFINIGCTGFNKIVSKAIQFFQTSPVDFMGGSGWSVIRKANSIFVVVGTALVSVFWLIGYLAETTDVRGEFRPEKVFKMYIKLLLAEFFVSNSLYIVTFFFNLAIYLGTGITGTVNMVLRGTDIINKLSSLKGSGYFLTNIVFLILALLFMIGVIMAAVIIVYQAFIRLIRALVVVPYGALAASTIAGNSLLQKSAEGFYKYALVCALDAVSMILALGIGAALLNSNILAFVDSSMNTTTYMILLMTEKLITVFAVAGSVKAASNLTQRALGL